MHVAELQRRDWFNVARSLLSVGYWRGKATVDPGYRWCLDKAHDAVLRALVSHEDEARRTPF